MYILLRDFSWSPKETVLAYWVAEHAQKAARVTLMHCPSKLDQRTKNMFNVADAELYWQQSGDHLAVKLSRYGKKKLKEGNQEVEYSVSFMMVHRVRVVEWLPRQAGWSKTRNSCCHSFSSIQVGGET